MLKDLITGKEFKYELYLCKPYTAIINGVPIHETIGCLTKCAVINNIKKEFKSVNELDFYLNLYWNDIENTKNEYFDLIKEGYIVLLESYIDDSIQEQEYFYIYDSDKEGIEKGTRNIKCYSKQYILNNIKIRRFQESDALAADRKLYTGEKFVANDNTKGGILDYIIQEKLFNTWSVEYVSPSIADKYRSFDISEKRLLDVFKYIESLYNCVVFFNNIEHRIRILAYEDLESETGLIISDKNYLKQIKEKIKFDEIVTRMYVNGKNDTPITRMHVTGQDYLDNFSFFKTVEYMSQNLIDALNDLEDLRETKNGDFTVLLDSLNEKNNELLLLNSELFALKVDLIQLEDNADNAYIFVTFNGHNYNHWQGLVISKKAEIAIKNSEISAKNSEIASINNQLGDLVELVSYESNLTEDELKELLQHIKEDSISCETEDEEELMNYALQVMDIKSTPPIDFELSLIDIFACTDANFTWDKLRLGALVDLEYDEFNLQIKPRVVSYTHSPSNNSLSVTVSNKPYYEDDLSYISNIIALTRNTSTLIENERDSYLEYQGDKDDLIGVGDVINTEENTIVLRDGTQLTRRGMYLKDTLDTGNTGQIRILGDRILLSNNDFADLEGIAVAITAKGIFCENFAVFQNKDDYGNTSFIVDKDGVTITNMALTLLSNQNKNTIYINPDVGMKLLKGETPVFYLDEDGNIYVQNITIGTGSSIKWESIDNPPNFNVYNDDDVEAYLTGTYKTIIDEESVWTVYIIASNIIAGTMTLRNDMAIVNEEGSVTIDSKSISIIGKNSSTMLTEYGLDPRFIKSFKNMVWNSSFELFNPITFVPTYWSNGISHPDANFFGSRSMRLDVGVFSDSLFNINPQWYNDVSTDTRVAFYKKFGKVKVEVFDITNPSNPIPYTLYNNDTPDGALYLECEDNNNWNPNRCTFHFTHGNSTAIRLRFTCTGIREVYIDAVSLEPDFTGMFPSFYTDGVASVPTNPSGDGGLGLEIYIQESDPTLSHSVGFGALWINSVEVEGEVEYFTDELHNDLYNASNHATQKDNPHEVTKGQVGLTNVDDVQQAPLTHVGATGDAHGVATTLVDGFMSASDKQKLNGVATNANNYTHPSTHPPSIIAQDINNRFVTDSEKSTWNGKQDALGYTPENVSNKKTTLTDSDTDYPTTKAVNTGLSGKQDALPEIQVGYAGKVLAINATEDGYEYIDVAEVSPTPLEISRIQETIYGNISTTEFEITHNKNIKGVSVVVLDENDNICYPLIQYTLNSIIVKFKRPQPNRQYFVSIL